MTGLTDYSPEQTLARDLLVAAVNGSINHWARVHGYLVDCPPAAVGVEGIDIAARSLWRVDLDAVERAITKLSTHAHDCFAPNTRYDSATRGAAQLLLSGLRDAYGSGERNLVAADNNVIRFAADIVFQVAVADEVIY